MHFGLSEDACRRIRVFALIIIAMMSTRVFAAPVIVNLGTAGGGLSVESLAISSNGSVVVGELDVPSGTDAFRWTSGTGMQDIGNYNNGTNGFANGVSGDGATIVGVDFGATITAFRWTSGGGFQALPLLDGYLGAEAHAISTDSNVIVGFVETPGAASNHASRWVGSSAAQDLGTIGNVSGATSYAYGTSANGAVVVGQCDVGSQVHGFRWTGAGGMQDLGVLKGGKNSLASACSADGSITAGWTEFVTGNDYVASATLWTNAGPQDIGRLAGADYSNAYSISADGTRVVGASGPYPGSPHAFLWAADLGMVDLNTYLPTLGVDLTGWSLDQGYAISADGTAITGWGVFDGASRSWLVTGLPVPEPGALAIVVCGAGVTCACRRRRK